MDLDNAGPTQKPAFVSGSIKNQWRLPWESLINLPKLFFLSSVLCLILFVFVSSYSIKYFAFPFREQINESTKEHSM